MRYYIYNQAMSEMLIKLEKHSTLTIEEWKAEQNKQVRTQASSVNDASVGLPRLAEAQ